MLSIALSIPLTTDVMLPVICLIVTAVSTLLATASRRLARRSRFKDSDFFRIALEAYIRAPSLLPCWSACHGSGYDCSVNRNMAKRTFFNLALSAVSSFCAFFACLFSVFAVNCVIRYQSETRMVMAAGEL